MSIQTARDFVKQIGMDEQLQRRVASVRTEPVDDRLADVVEIGADAGFAFTVAELQKVVSELSDEQLEAAVGGRGESLAQDAGGEEDEYVAAICNGVSVLAWARVDGES